MKARITKASKWISLKVGDIVDADIEPDGLVIGTPEGAYLANERFGIQAELVDPEEFCPDCDCNVPVEDWECTRADVHEWVECPDCGYIEKISGFILQH